MKLFLRRFVIAMLAATGVSTWAQPQAPIEWGEARWAYLAGWPGLPQITTLRVIPMGDTLLFTALNVGTEVSDTILVCSSFDNGQTFTPWVRVTNGENRVSVNFTGSAGRFYCFFNRTDSPTESCWVRISEDGGETWGPASQGRRGYPLHGFAVGNEVLAAYTGLVNNVWSYCVIHGSDGGQSWSAPIVIDTADFYLSNYDQSIAFTETHCLIVEEPVESVNPDPRLYVARGDRSGQNWTPFELLPCQYYDEYACQNRAAIIGDTASEAAGVLGIFGQGDFSFDRPFFFRTTNGGESWEGCIALTEEPHVIPWWSTYVPINIGQGRLWLVGWEHDDPQGWNFLGVRFSANHGKNWYPLQVAADSLANADFFSGQIRGNRVDLYWEQGCCAQFQPWDYRMVTGTITPDTTLPELSVVAVPPETVRVGQRLQFSVTVSENDTLSEVRLVIAELSGDTARFGMARGANNSYHFSWRVPDSGYYNYWFEAEDWWENVGTLPDSGTFHFTTEGWSSADNPSILSPSSFIVSVLPNPFNSSATFTFTLPRASPVTLSVFNTLGQRVRDVSLGQMVAGEHRYVFEAGDLPSGMYLARVEAAGRVEMRKVVLLR